MAGRQIEDEEQQGLFEFSDAETLRIRPMNTRGGVECPQCGCTHREVDKTVPVQNGVRRYAHCAHCGRKFSTIERLGSY